MRHDRLLPLFAKTPPRLRQQAVKAWCLWRKRRVSANQTPRALIFFITHRCNLRCSHCFFWREINQSVHELTLEDIRKIARSMRHPLSLSLTGGEPFLRSDVPDILDAFNEGCGMHEAAIATNGTLTERIVDTVDTILKRRYLSSFGVQVSIDGTQPTHDAIRQVPGTFQKAMRTIASLTELTRRDPRLSVHAAVAVQKRNLSELEAVVETLLPFRIPIRFNIVRGGSFGVFGLPRSAAVDHDPEDHDGIFLSIEDIRQAFRRLTRLNETAPYRFWSERQRRIWELSLAMLETRKPIFPCYASRMESVLYAQGDVAFCELSRSVANIRDFGLDMAVLWASDAARRMRPLISKCFCIHGCNLTTGLTFDSATVESVLMERAGHRLGQRESGV
ncbi:radical SAM protein [Desulfatirhabdium butyrativorans]|uniref:radical SAM protein n=1 Tax=Desulfatirhabdium butyrativorans TaxID=340467 RepID=UPI000418D26E|nr:radical SAM protein [Desulfatirhabdium butyrativorans]